MHYYLKGKTSRQSNTVRSLLIFSADVAVSGYRLITGVSSDSDVAQLASMCNASSSSFIDLTIEDLNGASVAVPSVCYSKWFL